MGEYASPYHGLSLTLHLLSKSIRSTAELLHVSNTNTNTNSPAKKRRAVILPNTFTNPKESLEAKSDADIPTLKPAAPTVNADDVDFDNLESTVAVDSMTGYCCRISHADRMPQCLSPLTLPGPSTPNTAFLPGTELKELSRVGSQSSNSSTCTAESGGITLHDPLFLPQHWPVLDCYPSSEEENEQGRSDPYRKQKLASSTPHTAQSPAASITGSSDGEEFVKFKTTSTDLEDYIKSTMGPPSMEAAVTPARVPLPASPMQSAVSSPAIGNADFESPSRNSQDLRTSSRKKGVWWTRNEGSPGRADPQSPLGMKAERPYLGRRGLLRNRGRFSVRHFQIHEDEVEAKSPNIPSADHGIRKKAPPLEEMFSHLNIHADEIKNRPEAQEDGVVLPPRPSGEEDKKKPGAEQLMGVIYDNEKQALIESILTDSDGKDNMGHE